MSKLRTTTRALTVAAAVWAFGAGAAGAVTSWQGSDYSYDYSSKTHMAACDAEGDGVPVKGEYDFNSSGGSNGSVKDSDGSNGVCATKDTAGTVARHKTCEYQTAWPDSCGNWQAT